MRSSRFKKGDLVRHRTARQVGVVVAVCKVRREIRSIYVIVNGKKKRWAVFDRDSICHIKPDSDLI